MNSIPRNPLFAFIALFLSFNLTFTGYAQETVLSSPSETQEQQEVPVVTPEEAALNDGTENPLVEADPSLAGPLSPAAVEAAALFAGTTLPGRPTLGTFAEQGTVTTEQTSSSQFQMNYTLNSEEAFGGAILFFNSEGTTEDLSALNEISFDVNFVSGGCAAGGESCLKFEVVDSQDRVAVLFIPSVTANASTVTFTEAQILAANPNVDLTAVKQINFVLEARNLEPNTGAMNIQIGGLAFTPRVAAGGTAVTPGALPGTPVFSSFDSQVPSTSTLQTVSDSQFLFNYNLSAPGSFAGPIINYAETTQGSQDFSTSEGFVFNLRSDNQCTGSKCLKIEFQDTLNNTAVVEVESLTQNFQSVTVPVELLLEANPSLNLASIRQINFVLEEGNVSPKQGFLEVQTSVAEQNPNPNPSPSPNPNPTPNPVPTANPSPAPNPSQTPGPGTGGEIISGVTEGQTVSGTIQIQAAEALLPQIRKAAYYLNGAKAGRSYEGPFTWGGAEGFDTTRLPDGTYTLSGYVTTSEGDREFSVTFTVQNGNAAPPATLPGEADAGDFIGITENENVTGTVNVRPDLEANPNIHKVFYYLDGNLLEKDYDSPFEVQFNADELEPGTHTLGGLYSVTSDGIESLFTSSDYLFEISFQTGGTPAGTPEVPETEETSDPENSPSLIDRVAPELTVEPAAV